MLSKPIAMETFTPRSIATQHAASQSQARALENPSTEPRPAKRNRITIACIFCRHRKSRCDGARPKCSSCFDHGYDCTYTNTTSLTKTSASKEYFEALESRLTTIETSLADVTSRVSRVEGSQSDIISPDNGQCQQQSSNASDNEEGAAVDTNDPTDGIGSISFTKEEESSFFGPSSNIALTRQIVRTTTEILKSISSTGSSAVPNATILQSHMLHVSRPPSPVSKGFDSISNSICVGTEPFILPQEDETVQMMERFFNTTGELFPYIDKEAFFKQYEQLTSANIRGVRRSWLGLLNMVFAMATSASHHTNFTACEQSAKSDIFFRRSLALCDKQIRYGTSLEVVQLLLLMSQYLQGTERSIQTWNVHGLAVKVAYQLGLHSSNAIRQYPPLEREIRKRTWFGCVILDRTLSMTMGRPSFIPDSFVKLDLPRSFGSILPSGSDLGRNHADEHSVAFYTGTITLYKIMGEVVEVLYGNNLGCSVPEDLFDIASSQLQFEQKFLSWQRSLPTTLSLVEAETINSKAPDQATLRLRVILTLRYLNLRILTHTPLLSKYLECMGNVNPATQQLSTLKQICSNSVRTCVHSAISIIKLVREVLAPSHPRRDLLGAWWFSLYYTFNAALVIYAALLIQHQAQVYQHPLELNDSGLSTDSLNQAINCLSLLFRGNRMTEKCVRYISSLANMLSIIIGQPEGLPDMNSNNFTSNRLIDPSMQRNSNIIDAQELFDFFDSTDLHMGISLDDLLQTSNFNFPSSHQL